jgi:hypothetical protein
MFIPTNIVQRESAEKKKSSLKMASLFTYTKVNKKLKLATKAIPNSFTTEITL